ncbi:type II secretion system protein N [Vibrio tapetis]|uniref:Type II secretion system protein N n=1 Tax=Vibrio tapetis subsp. tapetis TaxID=1671868 RepID=A0A2N8ZGP1_9VIBR|nr:type II secretion system protein N [Vibrio tapetis]SON51074.1 Type II secretion system protein N [Vibrio tapetis subsp. tapetis]
MKRIIGYISVFVVVLLASLIAHLPAGLLVDNMPKIRGLNLSGVQGTLWQGHAENVHWQGRTYGQLNWEFQPSKLLTAKAEFRLRFGRGSSIKLTGKGNVGVGLSGFYGENILAAMPAEKALLFTNLPVPIDVSGQLEVALKHVIYAKPWCQSAEGSVVWNQSQVDSPLGALEAGPIVAHIQCENSQLLVNGEQHNDQLTSEFEASLSSDMTYKADGWFKPGADFPPRMASQLQWLGSPNNQGQYTLNYAGRVPL